MGAGLTRSFGFFFAILALFFGHKLFVIGGRGNLALTAIFASLSVVSHPGAGAFGLVSLLTLLPRALARPEGPRFPARGGRRMRGPDSAVVGYRPLRHGLGPLTAAAAATEPSQTVATLASLLLLGGTASPLLSVVALLGVFVCVARARWLLPLWLLATAVMVRNLPGPPLALILALLVGEAMGALILPGLGAPGDGRRGSAGGAPVAAPATGGDQGHSAARWARLALVALLLRATDSRGFVPTGLGR